MSKENNGRHSDSASAAKVESTEPEYRVGPGNPPREHQFKPGQSGNPKGAKRKQQSIAPDLKKALEHALNKPVTLKQGDKERTDLMDRTVDGVLFEESKHCLQECRKFGLTHFACGHRKLAMTHAAKPAHVAVDCDVVRRICEYEFRLGAFEQAIVSGFISSIAA